MASSEKSSERRPAREHDHGRERCESQETGQPRDPRGSREPDAPRRARARKTLKMQAIGFLSRREYSRQELRAKLLDSLRQRAREDAALAAAADVEAREIAQALAVQPSNGIDDAFGPRVAVHGPMPAQPPARKGASRERASPLAAGATRAALATLTRGDGGALPAELRSRLDAVALADAASRTRGASSTCIDSPASATGDGGSALAEGRLDDFADVIRPAFPERPEVACPDTLEHTDPEAAVEQLLDWLVAQKYLNETRFVESRVNARLRKQGTLRIKLELARHGLALEPDQAAALRDTEFARARALWQRKFGTVATDARERARQGRFLAARGFASDVVRRIVGGLDED